MESRKVLKLFMFLLSGIYISMPVMTYPATTGKIAGKVIDKGTQQPLPGANVMILGTTYGGAADLNGDFFILNIPPGKYTVQANMMGYTKLNMVKK